MRYVEVDESHEGQRLDNFLIGRLKDVPKSHVYRVLRRGEVRVNSARAAPEYRLQSGDRVRIPPLRQGAPPALPTATRWEWLRERVLYEDDDLLIMNKPAGLAVHAGSGIATGIIEALRALRPELIGLELGHRLDRDTSGCLVLAKRRPALLALHRMWREEAVEKRYLALVRGRWRGASRQATAPLARDRVRGGDRRVQVSAQGRAAQTEFTPQGSFGPATLMEVRLYTGRTHQARVHAASLGHPIAGDDKYGDRQFNRDLRREAGLRRLFLHAARLKFAHPIHRTKIDVRSPLPQELESVLERLREKPSL